MTKPTDKQVEEFIRSAKPYPFCGGADLYDIQWWNDDGEIIAICCQGCQAEAPMDVWNQRKEAP